MERNPYRDSGDQNSPLVNKAVELSCGMVSSLDTDMSIVDARNSYLTQSISKITIWENIFSSTLTGEIEVFDAGNLSTNFIPDRNIPALGIEQFALSFGVWNPRTRTKRWYGTDTPLLFAAYRQSDRIPASLGGHTLRIKLASIEFLSSLEHRISQKYPSKGQTTMQGEDIIRDILQKRIRTRKKFEDVEPTGHPITLTVPFLSPLETIRLIALQSQPVGPTSNYLFYESLYGFHFKTIAKMIKDGNARLSSDGKSLIPLIHQQMRGLLTARNDDMSYTADSMDLLSGYDMLHATHQGFFASTTYAVDILSGVCRETISRSTDEPFASRLLVNGPKGIPFYPFSASMIENIGGKTRIYVVPTTHISAANSSITAKDGSVSTNYMAETLASRSRELTALQSRTIRVLVAGAPELTAGSLVDIVFPNPVPGRNLDIASGRYLIIAAQHTIQKVSTTGEYKYETLFEACTDSHATSMRPVGE